MTKYQKFIKSSKIILMVLNVVLILLPLWIWLGSGYFGPVMTVAFAPLALNLIYVLGYVITVAIDYHDLHRCG